MPSLFQLPKTVAVSGAASYPGSKLYFYSTGTTNLADVYTDSALSVAHASPVVADSDGVFAPIYLDPAVTYKVTWRDSAGSLIYTVDPANDSLSAETIGLALYPRTAAEISAGVTPSDYTYPVGHMFRYGVPTNGSSDCSPALNQAIAVAAEVTSGTSFYFPAIGQPYKFLTKPDDITCAMRIHGDGRQTQLERDYNCTTSSDGLLNFRVGASDDGSFSVVSDMSIVSISGRSGGCLVSVVASAADNVTMCLLRNLRLTTTGTSTHDYAVYIDGSLKTGSPVGVRVPAMEVCDVFGGLLGALYVKSTVAFRAIGVNTFSAGGASGDIVIRGTASVPAYYTYLSGGFCAGIDAERAEQLNVNYSIISGNVTLASTVIDPTIIGHCTATLTDSATYTNAGMASALRARDLRADKLMLNGVTSTSFALEALGAICGKTVGAVTNVGHVGGTFTTVCPDTKSFTIETTNTLKDLRIATAGGAAANVRGDYKTATLDIYDPSNEYENSSTPSAGQTGISKSANSHVITIKNGTGSSQTYTLLSVGNVSAVTDPA